MTALALAGLLGGVAYVAHYVEHSPVVSVRIAGEFRHVDRPALREAVARHLSGGFFRLNVDAVRSAALQVPWVKDVSVRRVWPNSLHVGLIERRAVARWGDEGGLLEDDGTLFFVEDDASVGELVRLQGPSETHREVLSRYRELKHLVAPLARTIRSVSLSQRRSWEVVLDNGVELILGAGQTAAAQPQLERAFQAVLRPRMAEVERIDLRYANGFAVRWRQEPVGERR